MTRWNWFYSWPLAPLTACAAAITPAPQPAADKVVVSAEAGRDVGGVRDAAAEFDATAEAAMSLEGDDEWQLPCERRCGRAELRSGERERLFSYEAFQKHIGNCDETQKLSASFDADACYGEALAAYGSVLERRAESLLSCVVDCRNETSEDRASYAPPGARRCNLDEDCPSATQCAYYRCVSANPPRPLQFCLAIATSNGASCTLLSPGSGRGACLAGQCSAGRDSARACAVAATHDLAAARWIDAHRYIAHCARLGRRTEQCEQDSEKALADVLERKISGMLQCMLGAEQPDVGEYVIFPWGDWPVSTLPGARPAAKAMVPREASPARKPAGTKQ